jgi:hypothetical protein
MENQVEEKREVISQEEANNIAKNLTEKYQLAKLSDMIKDNKIYFSYKEKEYRIRLLNTKEKDELYSMIAKKHGELLNDKSILSVKKTIKHLREKDIIDITELDDQIKKINLEINSYRMKLGEELSNETPNDQICNKFKNSIEKLISSAYAIEIRKRDYLIFTFEIQLEGFIDKAKAFMMAEVKDGENFKKAFCTMDDFLIAEEELIAQIIIFSRALMSNV